MAPSSPTASRAFTHWRTLPQRTERGPAAFVATSPPEVAKAPSRPGVGREPQPERPCGSVHLSPGHRRADPDAAPLPAGLGPREPLAQIHDHAAAHTGARHSAPSAPGHERRARLRRPADQLLQVLHAARDRDAGGDDAVDPPPLRVGGAGTLVGPKAREGGMGKGRRHVAGSYHAPRTTHYVPVCLTRWGPRVMQTGT